MEIGIFAKTFQRSGIAANLDAVVDLGLTATQYNLSCAGLPTLPDAISLEQCTEIRDAHHARGLSMVALSATFNVIDRDIARREANLRRLDLLAAASESLGTNTLTLCTGTCDPRDMWKWHPDNASTDSWRQLVTSMHRIAAMGEKHRVTMAIEPERNNVVDSAQKARLLLDEIDSPRLKIVLDGANLIDSSDRARMRDALHEGVELLAPDIVLAHAKDCPPHDGVQVQTAGRGRLDYEIYLHELMHGGFTGPLVLHGLEEREALTCSRFLRAKLASISQRYATEAPLA
ncbi:MAG: sugar phosphate isomerase/epimerase [Pirellulales bacterium]|nr:sugar phosphate isomerase/epimerase [Pirellulales bacterium]